MTKMPETLFPFADAVAVVGSRGYSGAIEYAVEVAIQDARGLVSGGARHVDQTAELRAAERGLDVLSYRPKRTPKGDYVVEEWLNSVLRGAVKDDNDEAIRFPDFPSAAKHRNWWIVRDGHRGTHALWDGMSSGTAHGIAAAVRLGRPLRIWMWGDS